jgi:hypothetical protein
VILHLLKCRCLKNENEPCDCPIEVVCEGVYQSELVSIPENPEDDRFHDELIGVRSHVVCPCWRTGEYVWTKNCRHHPWEL